MKHPLGLFFLLPLAAFPQTGPPETRAGQIEAERLKKAATLHANQPDRVEAKINRFENSAIYKGLFNSPSGLGVRFGGLETGSGFGLGPQYLRPDLLKENLNLRIGISGSIRRYWTADALLSFPRLLDRRLQFDAYAVHSDATQVAYYGPGNDSHKTGRTDFRRENTILDFRAGWRIDRRHILIGATTGVRSYNVGPGRSSRFASAEQVYSPMQAPGIDNQSTFFHYGPFVQLDYRDRRNDPHRGTNFVTRYNVFDDRDINKYSFSRLETLIEQYVPILNEKRTLAFRARTDFTFVETGHQVPFYLQPTLGGSDDLRGFRNFRFYDNNAVLMNAEYRWEVAPALDLAIFADAGRVFSRPEAFSLSDLKAAAGFGFRFKTRDAVALRIDTGFSSEGWQIWFKFNGPFPGLFHNIF